MLRLSKEQARILGAAFSIEEIKGYIAEHRTEFETWLAEETANKQPQEITPHKRRTTRKGVK